MHFDLGSIIGLAATVLGTWLGSRIIRPRDVDRAAALDRIAKGAVAIIVSLNPSANWPKLLELAVDAIARAAGVPTTNREAIERAAAAALLEAGKQPGA